MKKSSKIVEDKIYHGNIKNIDSMKYLIEEGYNIIHGDVDLFGMMGDEKDLSFMKQIKKITGILDCSLNKLESIVGCPKIIEGSYIGFGDNKIKSLKGIPSKICGSLHFYNNKLKDFKYCPEEINGHFLCGNNLLTSLKGCPRKIFGLFSCNNNNLTSIKDGPDYILDDYFCYDNPIRDSKRITKRIGKKTNCKMLCDT